jgi:hypothetical protein
MDEARQRKLSLGLLAGSLLLMAVCWNMPGCRGRRFPPRRDPHAYVLEVYQVEVSGQVGRTMPAIEEVMGAYRTRLLARFPLLKLAVGGGWVAMRGQTEPPMRLRARLVGLQDSYASMDVEVQRGLQKGAATTALIDPQTQWPLDTWGTSLPEVNPDKGTLRLLVYRLNSPGGE